MYYFPNHRLGFFHIPKTGGSSFSEFLIRALRERGDSEREIALDRWHEPIAAKRQVLGAEAFDDSIFITTVRNPYATVVSLYFWYRRKWERQHPDNEDYPEAEIVAKMEFDEYVDWYLENERTFDEYLLLEGRIPPNLRIAKLETVDADAQAILNAELGLGLEVSIPVIRNTKHGPYMSYLNPGHVERINTMYAWVFEHLYEDALITPAEASAAAAITAGRTDRDAGKGESSEQRMRRAYKQLAAGQPKAALRVLGRTPDEGESPLAASARFVAQGMLSERNGDAARARESFESALEHGAPLPVLLRETGRYFRDEGSWDKAYRCFSVLDSLKPGSLEREFLERLPPAQAVQYGPPAVQNLLLGSRPRFYRFQQFKSKLVEHLGVDAAALLLGEWWGSGGAADAARLEPTGLLDLARDRALAFEELAPPREVRMEPPAVAHGASEAALEGRTRSFFFCVLADVVVTSKSNLLLAGDRLVMDYQEEELTAVAIDLRVDPIVLDAEGDRVTVMHRRRPQVLERAFSLVGMFTHNFGHWVVEQMFKVLAALERPGFDSVPLLIDAQMPPQLREMLELFVGEDHPVVVLDAGDAVRVAELWTCSMVAYWPGCEALGAPAYPEAELADAEALAAIVKRGVERAQARLGERPPAGHGARLYLTRRGRRLTNRSEVEGWFVDHGFDVVDFAGLPYAEQLRRLHSSEIVVVEDGSARYGVLFAPPGLRIGLVTMSHGKEAEWLAEMCRALGHRLLLLPGEITEEHAFGPLSSDYRIDLDRLPAFLRALEAGP